MESVKTVGQAVDLVAGKLGIEDVARPGVAAGEP